MPDPGPIGAGQQERLRSNAGDRRVEVRQHDPGQLQPTLMTTSRPSVADQYQPE
jgi:hypothetical protein